VKITAEGHDFLFIDEVSEQLRIPLDTLRYWRMRQQQRLRRGEDIGADLGPPSFMLARRVRYLKRDVDAWVREQQKQARRNDASPHRRRRSRAA
jgi:hypothetical protein